MFFLFQINLAGQVLAVYRMASNDSGTEVIYSQSGSLQNPLPPPASTTDDGRKSSTSDTKSSTDSAGDNTNVEDEETYPLYQSFWENAKYSGLRTQRSSKEPTPNQSSAGEPCQESIDQSIGLQPTERDLNISRMSRILSKKLPECDTATTVKIPGTEVTKPYIEISWQDVQDKFVHRRDFFHCLSLYFDFMPKDSASNDSAKECVQKDSDSHPYPLKVNMKMLGHKGSFYIFSKAQVMIAKNVWDLDETNVNSAMQRSLYVVTCDEDFQGTKQGQRGKTLEGIDAYNYEAYKDVNFLLSGEDEDNPNKDNQNAAENKQNKKGMKGKAGGKQGKTKGQKDQQNLKEDMKKVDPQQVERESMLAGHIIDTLDGKDNQTGVDLSMPIKRAMWMAMIIPFVAEPAPPSNETIRKIRDVYLQLTTKGVRFDGSMKSKLVGLGGGNPGCDELCYELYKSIRRGANSFRNVLFHTQGPPWPDFTPSKAGVGVQGYRLRMFNHREDAIGCIVRHLSEVSIVNMC